jgi:SAM-dependent methyltransferase
MITLDTLQFLRSDTGTDLLTELASCDLSDANTLKLLTQIRKRYSPDNASAALETARLRVKAAEKINPNHADVNRMFFIREALEQASHWAISYYVHRVLLDDSDRIADLGCSIGFDSLYLAQAASLIGLDRDPVRLAIAKANIVSDHATFIQADLTNPLPFAHTDGAFFDPARRSGDKRIFSVNDYSPPLSIIQQWDFESLLVKLSPGVALDQLSPYVGSEGLVNFVSLNGDLKEALLCLGGAAKNATHATVLTHDPLTHQVKLEQLSRADIDSPPLREPQGYLYEPDPAIIRAGLLGELGERLGIQVYRMDESIAYLTADSLIDSPLARAWQIEDWMPFNVKKLRAVLRERSVGRVIVKKRGSPITPESLIAQLKLSGEGEERVVVLTHVMDQPAIVICQPR